MHASSFKTKHHITDVRRRHLYRCFIQETNQMIQKRVSKNIQNQEFERDEENS